MLFNVVRNSYLINLIYALRKRLDRLRLFLAKHRDNSFFLRLYDKWYNMLVNWYKYSFFYGYRETKSKSS